MENITINIPEGYEIDMKKSDLSKGIVQFKQINQPLTYRSISEELFTNKPFYWISENGKVLDGESVLGLNCSESNNSTTKEQLESILALNKLCNVAKYLNGDWIPDFKKKDELYYLSIVNNGLTVSSHTIINDGNVFFKTFELAQKAVEILGGEEIRRALTLSH
jgi:hypothetical protein